MAPNGTRRLLIRADAGDKIGTGHLMRCLALAQAWQMEGGEVYLLTRRLSAAMEKRVCDEGLKVTYLDVLPEQQLEDAHETVKLAGEYNIKWVVVDSYYFDPAYYLILKEAELNILGVDDYAHLPAYAPVDMLLNQNIYASAALYAGKVEAVTKMLLGCRYVLLRREFWPWRSWQREIIHNPVRVLITLGGSDYHNVTQQVLTALSQFTSYSLEIMVVLGSYNQNMNTLSAAVDPKMHRLHLKQNVDNMPELLAWADIAITAGGSTCWELAFMGLPGLIIITAENQQFVAEKLAEAGFLYNLGWFNKLTDQQILTALSDLIVNDERYWKMSVQGRKLVDGFGAKRVVDLMLQETGRNPDSSTLLTE